VRETATGIERLRPDIVHTSLFEADVIGRLAARGHARVVSSIVNTSYEPIRLHDPNVSRWRLHAGRWIDGWTARRYTDRFHAISNAVRESAIKALGIDPGKVVVIPRGRDRGRLGEPSPERRARQRDELGIPRSAPVVLHLGRHEFQKAIDVLLEASAQSRISDAVFLQAGRDGNASDELRALHARLGLNDRFRFLGHREDVGDLMAAADVFVFPSRFEGLGGSVIEAMAMGLPVVCTDVPALREVVEEGGNAVVTPVDDPRALAAALDALLGDPNRREAFGRRGRELFDERFDVDRAVARMVELYRAVVESREIVAS
jgi:glycosyltransferase involved in cell wall biosynthesis